MNRLHCLFFRGLILFFLLFLSCLLWGQDTTAFWRKPLLEPGDSTYPVIRFSATYSGLWLPAKGLVVVPDELLQTYTAQEGQPLAGLQGELVLAQRTLNANDPSVEARDRLVQSLPAGGGKRSVWLESTSGDAQDLVLFQQIGQWTLQRRMPAYGVAILSSPELSGYENRVEKEKPEYPLSDPDTLRVVGFPLSSYHVAPQARHRHQWLRVVPFRQRILDSLGVQEPVAALRTSYELAAQDDLDALYLRQWPYQRTRILLSELSDHGHPLFQIVQVLAALQQRPSETFDTSYVFRLTGLFRERYASMEADGASLSSSLALYFQEVPGRFIPPLVVEGARFHQKDYGELARTLLAKSRLSAADAWLPAFSSRPAAVLQELETDYGYRFLQQLLYATVREAEKATQPAQQALAAAERSYYAGISPYLTRREANGSLREANLLVEAGAAVQGTIAPGMAGAAVLHRDGTPAGILLPCAEDMEWGGWHPETELICTRFLSVAAILRVLNE